jgi:preprotein translocase subunit SecA
LRCFSHQLLITRTAEAAEYFSKVFFQMDIPNNLLIAQNVAKEAQMIAEAEFALLQLSSALLLQHFAQ